VTWSPRAGLLRPAHLEWLALGLLTAVELVLFRRYVDAYVAPFYPVNHDQLPVLEWAYRAAGVARANPAELASWLPSADSLRALQLFKGVVLPVSVLTAVGVLGIGRAAAILANFAALAVGQAAVYRYLRRRFGAGCGLLGIGLFLLAGTHYYWAGGLNDLRRDYLGVLGMGLSFMAVGTYLARRGTGLALPGLALGFAALSRTVLLVYWVVTLGAAWTLLTGRRALGRASPRIDGYASRCGRLLALTGALGCLSIAAEPARFWRYYVGFRLSGDAAERFREFGADTLLRQALYYPASLLEHARPVLVVAAAQGRGGVAVRLGEARVWQRRAAAGEAASGGAPGLRGQSGLFGLLTACTIGILAWYQPSPLPIACLVIPLVLVLSQVTWVLARPVAGPWMVLAGVIALALGVGRFASEMRGPTYPPHPTLANATTVDRIQATLRERMRDAGLAGGESPAGGPLVTWLLVHDGLNKHVFSVLALERGVSPPGARHNQLPANDTVQLAELLAAVRISDAVVVPIGLDPLPAGAFEYAGNASVRRSLDALEAELRAGHELVESGPVVHPAGVAGLWIRKAGPEPAPRPAEEPAWLRGYVKFSE
jgi:hypothetical protein